MDGGRGIPDNSLDRFHPIVQDWFRERIGTPTDAQRQAWPIIADGRHVLVSAPTGSGKTLTAFLWAINQLIEGRLESGRARVLYISPLKALNNDIRRNLTRPLRELAEYFAAAEAPFPNIRAATRSGDTTSSERRRMIRTPPEILITTPESLNLLLSSHSGRGLLSTVETVILDEIHATAGTKRGVHLISAVERLARLAGEFQRVALSATAEPLSVVAEFVGGRVYSQDGVGSLKDPVYEPRPVEIVRSTAEKKYDISVRFPRRFDEGYGGEHTDEEFWDPFIDEFRRMIHHNNSTLFFTNSRRLCERITLGLNAFEEEPIAYSHHGSLAREMRETVERKLKEGDLKAIVATSSLEMGIDIGALDEVGLIQSPQSISSAIQRIGRAGHQVGETSRAAVFPTHGRDFIDAAVLAKAALEGSIEETKPIQSPLDVLAQTIVSMTAMETWDIDELYHFLRTAHPFWNLEREPFDAVLNMLEGRYAETRVRELNPRISIDRIENEASARPGAAQTLYMSGGTIPDRGYFHLRHQGTGARIGELDEEFVWERDEGAVFTLGAQSWKIERITNNDVFVSPAQGRADDMPFWRSEKINRDFHFSEQIGDFLERANESLEDDRFLDQLQNEYAMEKEAAEELLQLLIRQKKAAGELPHRRHLLIERIEVGVKDSPVEQTILHTLWGSRVNRPFAMALDAAFEETVGQRLEAYAENDCVVLLAPFRMDAEELISLVNADAVEPLLRKRLEGSGFFGARFRECAGRALLVTRGRIGQRMPLWLTRLRSKKLLESVKKYDDFPILLETWRTCLQDEFDMDTLKKLLKELETGRIRWTEAKTAHGSPFAQTTAWRQISDHYMYAGDEPTGSERSNLRGDLLAQVVFTPGLRPGIPREIIEPYEAKLQRTAPGYAPDSARGLIDWTKERGVIPIDEWNRLLAQMREEGVEAHSVASAAAEKLARLRGLIAPLEQAEALAEALYPEEETPLLLIVEGTPPPILPRRDGQLDGQKEEKDADQFLASALGNWAQFYGPFTEAFARRSLGVGRRRLNAALQALLDDETLIAGQLIADDPNEYLCDAQNFETLLRIARAGSSPVFEPLPFEQLGLFLAEMQGLTNPSKGEDGLFQAVEQLFAFPARAELWETEIFPARVSDYRPAYLDALMQEERLRWIGFEGRKAAFAHEEDFDLALPNEPTGADNGAAEQAEQWFTDPNGKYDYAALMRNSGMTASPFTEALWDAVWSGKVGNDAFSALRKGAEARFRAPAVAEMQPALSHRRRRRRLQRKRAAVLPGAWSLLPEPTPPADIVEAEERNKERVRALLDRYGILFRELLKRELPHFQWGAVFRALRIMELAGEVYAGAFFHGIPGLQFISKRAFERLKAPLNEDAVYWLNAADPASLCGLQLEAARGLLPRREPSAHMTYHGARLVLESRRQGKALKIHVPPDDERLDRYLAPIERLLTRPAQPLPRIVVETVNGVQASKSPYVEAFRRRFDAAVDYKTVALHRKYE